MVVDVEWYPIVALTCISPVTNIEHFFHYFLGIHIFSLVKYLLKYLAFLIVSFVLLQNYENFIL